MTDMARRALIVGAGAASLAGKSAPSATIGAPAPPFNLLTFEFKKVQYPELRGQVIMLNYCATWCAPCRIELPMLNAFYQRHSTQGLRIFAVKSEADNRNNQDLIALSKALAFPLVWHLNGKGYGEIGGALPTNYVIDRSGVLRYAKAGAFEDLAGLDEVVGPLLKEPALAAPPTASPT